MTDPLDLLARPQRQSRWAIVFLALQALRRIGVGQLIILALFVGRLPTVALVVLVPFAAAVLLAIGIVGWWRFTFVVQARELRVTRGILAEDRLSVPLDRVQSVSLEQGFLHRLIGLVGVSLETAGTDEAEFTIDTVEQSVAEALQQVTARHLDDRPADPDGVAPPPPPALTVLERDPARLLKAGVARPAFGGLALLFPLFAVAEDLAAFVPFDLPDVDEDDLGIWMLWLVPVAIVAATVGGLLLNLVQVILTQWDLKLTYQAGGFRRTAGLVSRTSRSTNIARIQAVRTRQNPAERAFGIRRVQLRTIGEGDLSLPGTDDHELAELRRLVLLPAARVDQPGRRIHPAHVFRETRNATVLAAIVAAGGWFVVGPFALLAALLIPVRRFLARRLVEHARWDLGRLGAARHDRVISAHTNEIGLRKVNGVSVRQSWFERSRGLATVVLRTAAGSLTIGMIPLPEAQAVRDRVLYAIEAELVA